MATATFYQRGESIDYTNSGASKISAGTIVLIGARVGVAAGDIAAGATGALHVEGIFEVPKEYADSGKAFTLGQAVYWDNTNSIFKAAVAQVVAEGAVTTEASAINGYVVAAAASAAKTALVKINA